MFISIFRLTKKCGRQYALHISLCIYSTFCFWLSKYTKQALSWHGYTARQAWGNLDQKEEWSQELGRAPVPQTPSDFHVERMLATLVTRGGAGGHGWIYFFPQIWSWSEENLKDALMMTVPVSCMELHWRTFLSLIYSDTQLPGEWCWWMHSREWHTLS